MGFERNVLRSRLCSVPKDSHTDDDMPTADLAHVIVCLAVTLGIGKHILVVPLGNAVTLLQVDQQYILVV